MKKWIGIALIGIMFFSTIAFAIIQAVSIPPQPEAPEDVQLPVDYVIDNKLTQAQYQLAISRGLTVMTYRYEDGCAECNAERSLLEQIVLSQEFQGQIILEEVKEAPNPKIEIVSFAGSKSLESVRQDEVTASLCELVINPPLGCVNLPQQ